jgi:hypothetical protein
MNNFILLYACVTLITIVVIFNYVTTIYIFKRESKLLIQSFEICDSANKIITDNLKLQKDNAILRDIVKKQYETLEGLIDDRLPY